MTETSRSTQHRRHTSPAQTPSSGQIIGQADTPFQPGAGEVATYGILLPENTEFGPYRLIAGLYDPSRPGAPRIGAIDGSDFVELGVLK